MLKRNIIVLAVGTAGAIGAWIAISVWSSGSSQAADVQGATGLNRAVAAAPPLPARPRFPGPSPSAVQQGLAAVVAAVRPSVVSIAAHREPAAGLPHRGMQLLDPFVLQKATVGSGVIVHPDGFVLTSRQVTGEAGRVRVRLFRAAQHTFAARRVAVDPSTDLALYRLALGGQLPFAGLGDSTRVRTGDIVMALGSPFGLSQTVTQGIVSTSRRTVSVEGRQYVDVIQTDAAINQGNCGGPLVDIGAEVIGINIAIYSTDTTFSGIGFAVPSNQAQAFVQNSLGLQH